MVQTIFSLFSFKNHVICICLGIKSVQNMVFKALFLCFLQTQSNLHMFERKVGPKHWFLPCFRCSKIPNPSFLSVFPLPKTSQNDPKLHLHTFLTSDAKICPKTRQHQLYRGSVRIFLRGPPAKADIATAILTNVT